VVVASPERIRADVRALAHRGLGVGELAARTSRILARAVPFDGFCLLAMDPLTRVPTAEVVENGLPESAMARMAEIELLGGDVNSFAALACATQPAASLSAATDGDLNRSQRHYELRGPIGFGDELRAALVSESATWGALTLLRGRDRVDYGGADAALLASVSGHLADGLRRALLLEAATPTAEGEPAVGVVLLATDDTVLAADATAERWLAELHANGQRGMLPVVVTGVAVRARAIASGHAPDDTIARARVRTASGHWLALHGSVLGDAAGAPTAVIVEPVRRHELAPLLADAYGLTERERAVTRLVARGLATQSIAERLYLSPWTVQDHLKSIYERTGVRTRGELVARLFFDGDGPHLDGAPSGRTRADAPD
jgi:DNA-binding CsgD family transcriptional regulator